MNWVVNSLAAMAGLGIIFVWLMRYGISPNANGQRARSMSEELTLYGLPEWSFFPLSFLEILSSVLLLVGMIHTPLLLAGASLLAFLMCGAIGLHFKVRHAPSQYIPAAGILAICVIILCFA